jgi:hypothetical protein
MEIATLTAFLSPFLPSLLKLGGKALEKSTESASGKIGEAAFEKAQAIWGELSPNVEIKKAAIEVANSPEDEDLKAVLQVQLKNLFKQNEELMNAIKQILKEDTPDVTPSNKNIQNVPGGNEVTQVINTLTGGKVIGNITGNVTM